MMDYQLRPNLKITFNEKFHWEKQFLPLIKKAAEINGKKSPSVGMREWDLYKQRGILKGTEVNPVWGWKVRGWISLAETYPFLNFLGELNSSGNCHILNANSSTVFSFVSKSQFILQVGKLVENLKIIENKDFLPLLSKEQLSKIQETIMKFQVELDSQLEKV